MANTESCVRHHHRFPCQKVNPAIAQTISTIGLSTHHLTIHSWPSSSWGFSLIFPHHHWILWPQLSIISQGGYTSLSFLSLQPILFITWADVFALSQSHLWTVQNRGLNFLNKRIEIQSSILGKMCSDGVPGLQEVQSYPELFWDIVVVTKDGHQEPPLPPLSCHWETWIPTSENEIAERGNANIWGSNLVGSWSVIAM